MEENFVLTWSGDGWGPTQVLTTSLVADGSLVCLPAACFLLFAFCWPCPSLDRGERRKALADAVRRTLRWGRKLILVLFLMVG